MNLPVFATVTRNTIRANDPCQSGLDAFNRKFGHLDPDTPIPLLTCLESNSVADVIWALRAVEQNIHHLLPLIAVDFAESVLPVFESRFPDDTCPRKVIETVRAFMRGEVSREVLEKARRDAADASYTATAAAAAYTAAAAATAAYTAATTAAAAAAYATAAAAVDAAYATAESAADAATNADADADAAADAERVKQAEILKRYFSSTPI